MTLTITANLAAEVRAMAARAGMTQEQLFLAAGLPRMTYYRRMETPSDFRLSELEALARAAGCTFGVQLLPLPPEPVRAGSAQDRVQQPFRCSNCYDSASGPWCDACGTWPCKPETCGELAG